MKRLLIALLLLGSLAATAQSSKKENTKKKPVTSIVPKSDGATAINSRQEFDLAVNAANGKSGYAMTYTKDSVLTVYDSAQTINVLVRGIKEYQAQIGMVNSQLRAVSVEAELAREIFRYINTDGTVSDEKKFKDAVDKYIKVLPK